MEQLNQYYQQDLSEAYFPLDQSQHGLSQLELNRFMQSLLTTIDLTDLAELYFQQLSTTLQLSGIKIQFQDQTLEYGIQLNNLHQKELKCSDAFEQVATIVYSVNHQLSLREWKVLQQMHIHFSQPFKNALTHYKVKQFAMKDFLTSLGNRASYDECVIKLISHAERNGSSFGLLVLDMDNFKQVNDVHGHHEGDKVLIECAKTILSCLRESDYAFRFGGDEFCCVLPDADSHTNQLIAERIRVAIESQPLLKRHQISCSIGTSNYQPNDNQRALFAKADNALYQAKNTGKNCIQAA